jgi:hypothetical protein
MLTKLTNAFVLAIFACWIFGFGYTIWGASHHSPTDQNANGASHAKYEAESPAPSNRAAVESKPSPTNNQTRDSEKTALEIFFEIKLTDVALIFFTAVLAFKTSGLFTETAGLRKAADNQRADMLRSIEATERMAKATEDVAFAAKDAAIAAQRSAQNTEQIARDTSTTAWAAAVLPTIDRG